MSQISRQVLNRFSDKFVRGLGPPESIQNRTACRSPTVARPLPHDIAANSPHFSHHPHVALPTAGIVPAVEKRSNDYHRCSGSVGSVEKSSPTHTATVENAGTVPAFGALSNDPYRFSGSIGFDERSIAAHAAPSPSCGDCPRDRRAK
ncbi:MAG UNVERIFIED_CONTAM: hypothetical protein LVR18_52250 [Planctomycetaceae bacterium]